MYLRDARHGYLSWGAHGKVRQLDEMYPHLREEQPAPGPTSTIGAPVEHLDLATVIKVSQTVSGEIVLEKLIDALMRTAIEQAGAGTARVTDGGAVPLLQRLAPIYLGPGEEYPPASMRNIAGYVTRIVPTRFSGIGPWAPPAVG
jgi:hypothetical protein